ADAEGASMTSVEGIAAEGDLHPIQQAFLEHGAAQCGYCTPGLVVAATHLLDQEDSPSRDDIREALAGNLCRCTGYGSVLRAIDSVLAEEEVQ
ncbi:MAG: 2Fe-2S iron-sulfur cluster-binding protein, partial [Actinomycetota bacterium]|nr:2Fe-2S iron-sulfur cluster-binding protein [Actinomycetota bacterium]